MRAGHGGEGRVQQLQGNHKHTRVHMKMTAEGRATMGQLSQRQTWAGHGAALALTLGVGRTTSLICTFMGARPLACWEALGCSRPKHGMSTGGEGEGSLTSGFRREPNSVPPMRALSTLRIRLRAESLRSESPFKVETPISSQWPKPQSGAGAHNVFCPRNIVLNTG